MPAATSTMASLPLARTHSPRASAVATTGALLCMMDSLWVSSKSSAWAWVPCASAAVGAEVRLSDGMRRARRPDPRLPDATCTARPMGVLASLMTSPRVSSTLSLTSATTRSGRSSYRSPRARHRAVCAHVPSPDGTSFVERSVGPLGRRSGSLAVCLARYSLDSWVFTQVSPKMSSAPFSPIIMAGALVLPEVNVGMIEASTTRRNSMPRTLSSASTTAIGSGPILQVPTG